MLLSYVGVLFFVLQLSEPAGIALGVDGKLIFMMEALELQMSRIYLYKVY